MKLPMTEHRSYIVGCIMNNTFVYTVTLYSKYKDECSGETKFKRTVHKNCYFGAVSAENTSDIRKSDLSTFVCRILGKVEIKPDDVIVKGEVFDEIEDIEGERISDLLRKYKGDAFTVKEVSDNALLPYFPHTRAKGE